MRVKELITRIKNNPYFQSASKLIAIDEETYKKHYCYRIYSQRWRWLDDDYSDYNRYYETMKWLRKRVREYHYSKTIEHSFEWFDVSVNVWSEDKLDYNLTSVVVKMSICDSLSILDTHIEELPMYVDLDRISGYIDKIIKQRYWTEGFIHRIQCYHKCNKKDAVNYYKEHARYARHLCAFDEEKSLEKIKKRFNINSHLDIYDTVKVVNEIGKQDKMKDLYRFDTSFMDYYEGDIDGLESAMWKANPLDGSTIYV